MVEVDGDQQAATTSLIRVTAALGGVRVVSLAAGFAANLVAARALGATGYGAVGVALTVATFAALLGGAGLNIPAIYYLRLGPTGGRRHVGVIVTLGLLGGAVAAALVVVALTTIGSSILPGQGVEIYFPTAILAFAILWFELAGGLLLGVGLERGYMLAQLVEISTSLVGTLLVVALAPKTAVALVAVMAVSYVLGTIYALARVSASTSIWPAWDASFARAALAMGVRGQAGNLLTYLNLRLDLVLVPALVGGAAAGVYFVATRLAEVVSQVVSSAGIMLFPHVAGSVERDEGQMTASLTRLSLIVVAAASCGLALVAPFVLQVAFGPEFASGAMATRILLVGMVPLTILRVLAGDLKGRGRAGIVSIATAVALVATVGGDLLLIPAFGIEGAAAASVVAYGVGAIALVEAMGRSVRLSWRTLVPGSSDVVELRRQLRALGGRAGTGA